MSKPSRLGKFVLYTIVWSLYLVIGMYLLIRAEGYQINFKDISFIETAVLAVEIDEQAIVQLNDHKEIGREIEFPDITPGRHIIHISSEGYKPISATMTASPRSVSRLNNIHLTPFEIKTETIANNADLVSISKNNRFAAVVNNSIATVGVYDLYSKDLILNYTFQLPDDFKPSGIKWNDNNKLILSAENSLIFANQSGILKSFDYPGEAKQIIPIPDTENIYLITSDNDLYLISYSNGRASLVLSNILALDIDANKTVRIARSDRILSPAGVLLMSPYPRGFYPQHIRMIGEQMIIWDDQGNSWVNQEPNSFSSEWLPGPDDLRGVILDPDEEVKYFHTSGSFLDMNFHNIFSGSNSIQKATALDGGLILSLTNNGLYHCSLSLRACSLLADDVDLLWSSNSNVVIKRDSKLEVITSNL
jgi:hypothetical protein